MDRAELRRLAEAAINNPSETIKLDCGTANIPSKQMDEYRAAVANPAAIIELLDRLERAENVCKEANRLNGWLKEPACSTCEWDVRQSWKEKWSYVVAAIKDWREKEGQ